MWNMKSNQRQYVWRSCIFCDVHYCCLSYWMLFCLFVIVFYIFHVTAVTQLWCSQSYSIMLSAKCFRIHGCRVQEKDKILREVSEKEEKLQKERDAKEKLQKQIQVIIYQGSIYWVFFGKLLLFLVNVGEQLNDFFVYCLAICTLFRVYKHGLSLCSTCSSSFIFRDKSSHFISCTGTDSFPADTESP